MNIITAVILSGIVSGLLSFWLSDYIGWWAVLVCIPVGLIFGLLPSLIDGNY